MAGRPTVTDQSAAGRRAEHPDRRQVGGAVFDRSFNDRPQEPVNFPRRNRWFGFRSFIAGSKTIAAPLTGPHGRPG